MEYLEKALNLLGTFVKMLFTNPKETVLTLFAISLVGNVYQYLESSKSKTIGICETGITPLMVYDSITTVKVLPILEDVTEKYTKDPETNVSAYSDALSGFYGYARQSHKVIKQLGKNKPLSQAEKKQFEDELIDIFKNSKR
jgi:hypothetical protein